MSRWTGRPPKFQDPDELEKKVNEYFDECDRLDEPYTVSGLALTLGIQVRKLRDYKNCVDDINILVQLDDEVKRKLSDIVKRAYDRCQNYAERKMLDPKCTKSPVGYLFSLKNFQGDWVDKTEQVVENKTIEVTLDDEE